MLCELRQAVKIRELIFEGDPQNKLPQYLDNVSNVDKFLITPYQIGKQRVNTLIVAAMRGHNHIVKLLLNLVEDRRALNEYCGKVYATGRKRMETGTALWCACDRAHYQVALTLMELGQAQFDLLTDRSIFVAAILKNRLDLVRFLIDNESKLNHSFGSQYSIRKKLLLEAIIHNRLNIVEYLIHSCINIEQVNEQMNFVLETAVSRGSLKIVQFLCSAGAFNNMKNSNDLTPMMIAVRNNRWKIVKYLLEQNDVDTNIKQLELSAASLMKWTSRPNPIETKVHHTIIKTMRLILELREKYQRPKMLATPIRAYGFQTECRTQEELNLLANDIEALMIEILLIQERLYVSENNETIFQSLIRFGDRLASQRKYQQCLYLWVHTFYIYQLMKLTTNLHRFVWLFCLMLRDDVQILAEDFIEVGRLVFEPSEHSHDRNMKNATCLAMIAVEIIKKPTTSDQEKQTISKWIFNLCRQKMRTTNGQTLLHLAVDASLNNEINFRAADIQNIIKFPSLSLTHFLLTYCSRWVDVNDVDSQSYNTPLHTCCRQDSDEMINTVTLLLQSNAHLDCRNITGKRPIDVARAVPIISLLSAESRSLRLKCICANMINQTMDDLTTFMLPENLSRFVKLHGGYNCLRS